MTRLRMDRYLDRVFGLRAEFGLLGNGRNALGRLATKWLPIVLLLCVYPAAANWGPDSTRYREEAQVIGAWTGEYSGQSFEVALWPSREGHELTGVMVWGDCKAWVRVSGWDLDRENPNLKQIVEANPGLEGYLYSFSSNPGMTKIRGSRCLGKDWPGYSQLFFNADKSLRELEALSYSTYPKLKKLSSTLTRSAPSPRLAEAIEQMARKHSYGFTSMAREVLYDPTLNYFDLSERQAATALDSVDGLRLVSLVGVVYEFKPDMANDSREYFDLVVVNTDRSVLKNNRSIGEIGGHGIFLRGSQELRITMHRKTTDCPALKDPEIRYEIAQLPGASAAIANVGETGGRSWALNSPTGECSAVSFQAGQCRVVSCNAWYKDRVNNQLALPLITDSPEVAETQAGINWMSIER